MRRRNALRSIGFTVGTSMVIPAAILQSCQRDDYEPKFFGADQIDLIDEIGEIILPETEESQGAKFINIGKFIDHYVADCLSPQNQTKISEGILSFEDRCISEYGKSFLTLEQKVKHLCLVTLDVEASTSTTQHYFALLKDLVLLGYFTSEEGATNALEYLAVPGRYDGDLKISEDHKSWALG